MKHVDLWGDLTPCSCGFCVSLNTNSTRTRVLCLLPGEGADIRGRDVLATCVRSHAKGLGTKTADLLEGVRLPVQAGEQVQRVGCTPCRAPCTSPICQWPMVVPVNLVIGWFPAPCTSPICQARPCSGCILVIGWFPSAGDGVPREVLSTLCWLRSPVFRRTCRDMF